MPPSPRHPALPLIARARLPSRATNSRPAPLRRVASFCLSFAAPRIAKVVLDRELKAHVVGSEAVRVVLAITPLQLATPHQVIDRVIQQVDDCVLSAMERGRRLGGAVVNVDHRVADRAGPLAVPRVIEE